jgi:hypothetical protein
MALTCALVSDMQDQINNQITTLNKAFGGLFTFNLANATWYTTTDTSLYNAATGSSGESSIKRQLRKGGFATLNIYTWGVPSNVLRWAYYPWSVTDHRDGVVVHFGTINGGTSAPYNLGATVVHEVGHWLGLYHTFEVSSVPVSDASETKVSVGCLGRNHVSCPQIHYILFVKDTNAAK